MRQLSLFDPPPARDGLATVAEAAPTWATGAGDAPPPGSSAPTHQEGSGPRQPPVPPLRPVLVPADTTPTPTTVRESWVMYAPADPGDDLDTTLRLALAAFTDRRGSPPSAVAAHPSGAAALATATALPIRPLATCPRGQVWLLLP